MNFTMIMSGLLLGLVFGFMLFIIGVKNQNSNITSIGTVIALFFLLLCINICVPAFANTFRISWLMV